MKTETINSNSQNLDLKSSKEFVSLFLNEEKNGIAALEKSHEEIASAIDSISKHFQQNNFFKASLDQDYKGPRLFYFGAGTSGRLGILDASECPPTFSAHPEMIQGIIAGGDHAIRHAVEGAEDNEEAGFNFVKENLNEQDYIVAISASGSAPYIHGVLKAAKEKNIPSIAISNNPEAKSFSYADKKICVDSGAEILSGSTRLKSGSTQKMTLNMISTGLMIQLGKVYSNLMVDLKASNKKLVKRAINLVTTICDCPAELAEEKLKESDFRVKIAVVMIKKSITISEADELLALHNGFLRAALA